MRSIQGTFALGTLAVTVPAWAQLPGGSPQPAPPSTPTAPDWGSGVALMFALVIGLFLVVGLVAKLVDLRRRREAEAVDLQARISDALLRDRALSHLTIVPVAHVPLWGSPATIVVSGEVPSPHIREAALRIAREEASRIRADFRLEDRVIVLPGEVRRAA